MTSDVSTAPITVGPGSVLSRVKAFESQVRADSAASTSSGSSLRSSEDSWDNRRRSKLVTDDEDDWVSVPTTAKALNANSLAPPLPARKLNHAPASSVGSFHSVSLSSDSIAIDDAHEDQQKEELDVETASLDSYENVDSTTSLGSPGAVARLTADWNQKRSVPSSPQRPHSAAPMGKSKHAPPPPPPRSASATFPSSIPVSSTPSVSNGRRPPPPPPSGTRASTSTNAGSDRSSILSTSSTTSNTSTTTTNSIHNAYPPYPTYKPKPPPPPNKPSVPPLKPPALKFSSSSTSTSSASSPSSALGPGVSSSASALSRPTPVPALARKRYEAVFDANLANLNLVLSSSAGASNSKPALLTPSVALAIPRKGWRGLSIDLITSDDLDEGAQKDKNSVQSDLGVMSRLPGPMVRVIWNKSRLGKEKLSAVWLESDPFHTGSLDKEAFVKGMWRIDAELRREELDKSARAKRTGSVRSIASSSQGSLRNRASAGSLRRTPIPPLSSLPMDPAPLIQTDVASLPPPLPVRKPTMGTGLGTGPMKMDLGTDEVDLLL